MLWKATLMPLETAQNRSSEARSSFAKLLATDPVLAERCEKVAKAIRDAAREDIQAGERAERLTKEDFAIYINARADGSFRDKD